MEHNSKEKARAGELRAIFKNKQSNYPKKSRHNQAKSTLPEPLDILAILGIAVPMRKNRKGYYLLKCLFHHDNNPSLHFHSGNGHYRCFSCGAKGGLVNFYMQATGKAYGDAIKTLKNWRA